MSYLALLISFCKIGLFSFGGGYIMIPFIEREIIAKHHWLTMSQFIQVIGIAEMTPGSIAVNSATFVGYKVGGFIGSLLSTVGVVIPSGVLILIIAKFFLHFQEHPLVQSTLRGIRTALVVLILQAALSVGKNSLIGLKGVTVILLALSAVSYLKINPILVIILAGLLGIFIF